MKLIGLLLSFILVNIEVSKGNPITTERNIPTDLSSSEERDIVLDISTLPFANHLTNPCSIVPSRHNYRIMEAQRARYATEFYKYIANYAKFYRQDTQDVVSQYAIGDCLSLGLEILPHTPTLQQLIELDIESAMNQLYYSLLLHSAYVYFIHHQYHGEFPRCPQLLANEKLLAAQSLGLANKQKSLVCTIQTSMSILGYNLTSSDFILSHPLTDLRMCSRMVVRDCQVLRSIMHLLNVAESYARLQT